MILLRLSALLFLFYFLFSFFIIVVDFAAPTGVDRHCTAEIFDGTARCIIYKTCALLVGNIINGSVSVDTI